MSLNDTVGEKKAPRYFQFYKQEWEKLPIFKGWLSSVPGSKHRAYCKYCRKEFRAHRTDLRSHARSRKHQRASDAYLPEEGDLRIYIPESADVAEPTLKEKKHASATVKIEAPSNNNMELSEPASDSSPPPSPSPPPPPLQAPAMKITNVLDVEKVRIPCIKVKEKHSRISTQVLDLVRGIPVSRMTVSLHFEHDHIWKRVGNGVTDTDGQWYNVFPNSELKDGRYKLHFETKKYFILGLHDTFYPYIEVVFDIAENVQQYHVPLLVSPFGYMVYRGGK